MDFYYHPILGLQFTCGLSIYEIDLNSIPQNYDLRDIIILFYAKGISIVNSVIEKQVNVIPIITSNSIL